MDSLFKTKACPVCGGVASVRVNADTKDFFVECETCNIKTGLYPSSLEAIKEWNGRHIGDEHTGDKAEYHVYLRGFYKHVSAFEEFYDEEELKAYMPELRFKNWKDAVSFASDLIEHNCSVIIEKRREEDGR